MDARIIRLSLPLIGLVLTTSLAFAQPRAGRGMGMPRYDKSTEVTVKGTVEEVQSHQAQMPMAGLGTHLKLKTESGEFDVHVGPATWLAQQKVEFTKGEELEVVGSSILINGEKALIAREITKGDRKITLRDVNGIPVWSGRGRRSQS